MERLQLERINLKIWGLVRQVMLINQNLDEYFEPKLAEKKRQIQNNLDLLHTQRLSLEIKQKVEAY